ncbi:hypothetical protein DFS34DRAFT_603938 [Phlyctochytrium arcticum]|nr:hypothetical protein DFS34DRAFT_603938 [Phlyctochytrium arcticum]
MRLLTHNMLQCHARNCDPAKSYPLQLSDTSLEALDIEFVPEFVTRLIPKLDWPVLVKTAHSLGVARLPNKVPEELTEDFLKKVHKAALETRVKDGNMKCNGCGHVYPIKDGIPNMLLQDIEL